MPENNDLSQYEKVCKGEFDKINKNIARLYDKLFEDNGSKCLQTKVNGNSQSLKLITGIFSAVGAAVLGLLVWLVKGKV